MWVSVGQAAASLLLLYLGGEWLVRGASALAARLGISSLAIGLTVVAFGTSAPELVVSLQAALGGANDISVANVVGSNIANIALILGLSALLSPAKVHAKILRVDAPLMIFISLALVGILANGTASRIEGSLLLVGLLVYVGLTFRQAGRESQETKEQFSSAAPGSTVGAGKASSLVLVGLAVLLAGGYLLVDSAVTLATALGLSQAVIGLTVVAVGTSLPELATSVTASLRGQGDIAIGNVVGSNIFNILGIIGGTALVQPLAMGAITWLDLTVMVALACLLTVFLFTGMRLGRVEGAVLLAIYVLYVSWQLA